MSKAKFIFVVSFITLIAGCAKTWIKADGAVATSAEVKAAKQVCREDDKIYELNFHRTTRDAVLLVIKDEASRQNIKDNYIKKEQDTYAEIDACMVAQGLNPESK